MVTKLLVILLALVLIGAPAAPAAAQDDEMPKLGIAPVGVDGTYFTLEVAPGTTRQLAVALVNHGTQPITARTYAADVYTIVNGGFGVRLADEPVSGPTTWLDYAPDTLELDPATTVERTFTIQVPEETPPGAYITSLVIENAEPIKGTGAVALNQVIRQAIAVAITVPGEQRPGFTIGAAQHKPAGVTGSILVAVTNTGTVHLKPAGELVLTDADGDDVLRQVVAMDSVYAGTETVIEVTLPTALPIGDYRVSLTLTDEATQVTATEEDLPLSVAVELGAPPPPPVTVDRVDLTESRAADGTLRFVEVAVVIENGGVALPGVEVLLYVTRDGEEVEVFPLGSSMTLAPGTTTVGQRYLPPDGWLPGTYAFAIEVVRMAPVTSDATPVPAGATVLATGEAAQSVEVR